MCSFLCSWLDQLILGLMRDKADLPQLLSARLSSLSCQDSCSAKLSVSSC